MEVEELEEEEEYENVAVSADTAADDELYQDAADTRTQRHAQNQGICARALYDYQAG